ncbi:MAG TPA: secretin and TonB N-terminal domain-containing protein [Anaeromyxobacteraceae bacterium]|nr:secretin and TonB N-terminal domain-containing protein [Anaeromyxobacteraceae bacterium]
MLALVLAALLAQPEPPAPPAPAAEVERASPAPRPPRPPPAGGSVLRGEWPAQPSGKRITLEDTTSVDDALEAIADAAGWNVVLNTHRTGNRLLVVKLRDVPVEEAIQAALQGTGLVATRRGDTVVVAPAGEPAGETQVLSGFDRPTGRRFTGELQATDAGEALRRIARAGGLSIVLPPGELPRITASFQSVPVEDALRAVLAQAELAATREGTLLVVTSRPKGFDFQLGLRGRLPEGIGREVQEAMREAEREMRQAQRESGRIGGTKDRVESGDLVLRPGERVKDAVAMRGSVTLKSGSEAQTAVAILGDATLEGGARAGEVVAVLGDVKIGPGAVVEGNATSVGGKIEVDPGAEVGGQQTSVPVPGVSGLTGWMGPSFIWGHAASPLLSVAQVLAQFALYFALGLLLLALFPRRVEVVAAAMVANPVKAILVGLLGTVAMPVLAVLLVVTLVGILLVPVQVLAVLAAGVLGFTALAFHVGRSLPIKVQKGTQVLQLAIGTAIVVLVTQIPILGVFAFVTGWLLVFGAVLRSRGGSEVAALPTVAVPPPPPPAAA